MLYSPLLGVSQNDVEGAGYRRSMLPSVGRYGGGIAAILSQIAVEWVTTVAFEIII